MTQILCLHSFINRIFIMPYLLWHKPSVYTVSSIGFLSYHIFYDTRPRFIQSLPKNFNIPYLLWPKTSVYTVSSIEFYHTISSMIQDLGLFSLFHRILSSISSMTQDLGLHSLFHRIVSYHIFYDTRPRFIQSLP